MMLAVFLAACPRFAGAVTTTNYTGPDNGLWTDSGNWDAGVPNSSGFDVLINSASPVAVQLDASETINNMSLNSPDTLSLLSTLTLAGPSLSNTGTILFNATASRPTLIFNANATLSGGGTILMTSTGSALAGVLSVYRLATDNFISGQGVIGSWNFNSTPKITNTGTISATTGTLNIWPNNASDAFINNGLLQANGGNLVLNSGIYTNTGGVIEAVNSSIATISGTVTGGTIRGLGGTVVLTGTNGALTNAALSGNVIANLGDYWTPASLDLGAMLDNAGTFTLPTAIYTTMSATTIHNTGVIVIGTTTLNADIQNAPDLALTGGGSVVLSKSECRFFQYQGTPASATKLTTDNYISGQGYFGGGFSRITNSGTITATAGSLNLYAKTNSTDSLYNTGILRADGGMLTINAGRVNNQSGLIEAIHGSSVLVNSQIVGGTIRASDTSNMTLSGCTGGTIIANDNSTISLYRSYTNALLQTNGTSNSIQVYNGVTTNMADSTNNGYLILHNTATVNLTGTLVNTGLIRVSGEGGANLKGNGPVVMTGGGSIYLTNPSALVGFNPGLTSNNYIYGAGKISGYGLFTNTGTITANGGDYGSGSLLIDSHAGIANGMINNGLLCAHGGRLYMWSGTCTNTGGSIQAFPNNTVYVNAPVIGGTFVADGTINFNASSQADTITGAGAVTVGTSSSLTSNGVLVSSLTLSSGAWHAIRQNGGDTGTSKVSAITQATAEDSSLDATLDVNDNKFIVQSDPTVPTDKANKAGELQSALLSGFHSGDWQGKGITSSTVAGDSSHLTTLALFDNADLGLDTFGGQAVDSHSLLIATALIADADRSGGVDATDFDIWQQHAGQFWPAQSQGDFNHDGAVDGRDFELWYTAAGDGAQATLDERKLDRGTLSAIEVPEPATGLMMLGVGTLLVRRRRRGGHGETEKRRNGETEKRRNGDKKTRGQGDERMRG